MNQARVKAFVKTWNQFRKDMTREVEWANGCGVPFSLPEVQESDFPEVTLKRATDKDMGMIRVLATADTEIDVSYQFPRNDNLFCSEGDFHLTVHHGLGPQRKKYQYYNREDTLPISDDACEEIRSALPETFNGLSMKGLKNLIRVTRAALHLD